MGILGPTLALSLKRADIDSIIYEEQFMPKIGADPHGFFESLSDDSILFGTKLNCKIS